MVVTRSVVVSKAHQTWQVHIHGHHVNPSIIPSLADIPVKLNGTSTSLLLTRLSQLYTCAGNPDPIFIALGKAKKNCQFLSADNHVMAYLDCNACVSLDGQVYPVTVCCSDCHLLAENVRCLVCPLFHKNLQAQHSQAMRTRTIEKNKNTNYR